MLDFSYTYGYLSTQMDINPQLVIVDEAGCVLEGSIVSLLVRQPHSLLLVGDPLQLQPFSHRQDVGRKLNHTR